MLLLWQTIPENVGFHLPCTIAHQSVVVNEQNTRTSENQG